LVFTASPFPPPRHTALTAPFVDTNDVRTRFFFCRVYTAFYALVALPAVSIPSRFTSKQLPTGL
jgi:Asp-tRNA(Asn)/Glu-tRNA(Gln) amidotransferase A subunit family amidase